MTVSVVHADTGSTPQGWRSLLWLAPLTALWIVLIYWQPVIQTSGVPTTTHQLAAHGLIALGLWLGLESTDLTQDQRRMTWLTVMIPYTLWFAVAWSAAINGLFRTGTSLPLLPLAIWLPVIIGVPALLLSKRVGQVLDAMPATWLVALQLYRVFGSWAIAAGLRGVLTGLLAWPAGIGDMLTGLFCLIRASKQSRFHISRTSQDRAFTSCPAAPLPARAGHKLNMLRDTERVASEPGLGPARRFCRYRWRHHPGS